MTICKHKLEFSKVMIWFVSLLILYMIVFSSYMMIKTDDLTPLAYLIPSIFGMGGSAYGFYYSKAKAENKIKLMKECGVKPTEATFQEQPQYPMMDYEYEQNEGGNI